MLLSLERFDEAAEEARGGLRVNPERADLLRYLGLALNALGQTEEAVGHLARAYELTRQNDYILTAATMLRIAGEAERAEECVNIAILNAADARAYVMLGEFCMAEQRFDEAGKNFSRALEIEPGDATAICCLAEAAFSTGQAEVALAFCDELLEDEPTHARALFVKARCLVEVEDFDGAIHFFEKALAWETDARRRAVAFVCLGGVFEAVECEEDAGVCYENAYTVSPQYDVAYVLHAQLICDDTEAALHVLRRGYLSCPQSANTVIALAEALLEEEEVDEAVSVLASFKPERDGAAAAGVAAQLVRTLASEGRWRGVVAALLNYASFVNGAAGGGCEIAAAKDRGFAEYALNAAEKYEEDRHGSAATARLMCVMYCFRGLVEALLLAMELEQSVRLSAPWGEELTGAYRRRLGARRSKFAECIEKLVSVVG